MGGGGGGSNAAAGTPATGGGSALNIGGSGGVSYGAPGNGGANTGGGGGGLWAAGTSAGSGGSGIVIIAFPGTAITSNAQAVLPSTILSSGKAVDVLSYDTTFNGTKSTLLSAGAYASIKGAFSCKLVNYNYFGPVMTLRHSADTNGNYTQNFYADVSGNLGTGYLGTGQSVSAWLTANSANTTYAYVTKWYNQGMDLSFNSATQYTLGSQPIYDVANGLINFGYVGAGANTPSGWTNSSSSSTGVNASNPNAYFKLPDYALPYCPSASYDTSFSYTYRHGNVLTGITAATVVGGGTSGTGKAFSAQIYTSGATAYLAEWYYLAGTSISPYAANSVFSVTYQASGTTTASAEYLYLTQGSTVNTISTGLVSSIRQQTPNNNAIGYNLAWGNAPLNGQLYNMYYFSSSLFNQDRTLVEATPYQYSAPAAITGLAASSVTATNFALACSAVTNAVNYVIYVNGAYYSTVAAVSNALPLTTITPGYNGPWTVNVYAYNSSNTLLATAGRAVS